MWKEYLKKHQAHLQAMFFIAGFLFDLLTLSRVDDALTLFLQTLYLTLLLFLLFVDIGRTYFNERMTRFEKYLGPIRPYQDEAFHFLLGALLSAYTIFYFKSASLANSFIFMFIMAALLVLNEWPLLKRQGLMIRIALLTLCLFSWCLFTTSIIFKSSGPGIFIFSFILCSSFITFLTRLVKRKTEWKPLLTSMVAPSSIVMLIMLVLFVFKLIPPVPLALKHIGIYHSVERENGNYRLSFQRPWWKFWHRGDQHFVSRPGDKIYVFTRVFAPGGFEEEVILNWNVWDERRGWQSSDKIALKTTGGREEGYRGFTYKSFYTPGKWLIKVQNRHELEIGRIYFTVVNDHETESHRVFHSEIH